MRIESFSYSHEKIITWKMCVVKKIVNVYNPNAKELLFCQVHPSENCIGLGRSLGAVLLTAYLH